MIQKQSLLFLFLTGLIFVASSANLPKEVNSFKELAEHHCSSFPIELIYRLASGTLAEKYGKKYVDIDCYVRQFVNKGSGCFNLDGQDKFVEEEQEDEQAEPEEEVPQIDPLVIEYAQGFKCLPQSVDPVEGVYTIWRFYRFMIQHDYAFEWMRAKIRAGCGYEAERPSSWMDGEQNAARLRLDKLFSNQFYDYVDTLMFKDFLHPIMTFFKKNVVVALNGELTKSGKPILLQYIESKNLFEKANVFLPVIMHLDEGDTIFDIFTYTLPGIPLLLGGSTSTISWAFTGVLVDRSNIEQIETVGNKFFHHGSEQWIKLQNITHEIAIFGESQSSKCSYVHSSYGTLYEKHSRQGKTSEYIARWHQNEKKVRVIFIELLQLIINDQKPYNKLEFPFNSLVFANITGIYHYVCFQNHPSYFLYPDLTGKPQVNSERLVVNPKKNFIVVTNTHLSTINQESYIKKEIQNPTEEQFVIDIRKLSKNKFSLEELSEFAFNLKTDPTIKKRKDLLIQMYRKAKFAFFPDETIRKQCDQLLAIVQRWDNDLNNPVSTPVFILWDYFFKEYTFNHIAATKEGANIAKHKVITESYWVMQLDLWKVGTSYGECDSHEWKIQFEQKLNGTGHNCTCFFNIMRGINTTRQILKEIDPTLKEFRMDMFVDKKVKNLEQSFLGSHVDQAFGNFYSRNLAFASEVDSRKIIYWQGYQENKFEIELPIRKQNAKIVEAQGQDTETPDQL